MSRAWPSMTGGVGMWLWSKPLQRRAGSVSVWREEADLRRFVRWPPHAEIMRRFRDVGTVQSRKWAEEDFDAGLLWRRAAYSLAGDDPALWRGGTER